MLGHVVPQKLGTDLPKRPASPLWRDGGAARAEDPEWLPNRPAVAGWLVILVVGEGTLRWLPKRPMHEHMNAEGGRAGGREGGTRAGRGRIDVCVCMHMLIV